MKVESVRDSGLVCNIGGVILIATKIDQFSAVVKLGETELKLYVPQSEVVQVDGSLTLGLRIMAKKGAHPRLGMWTEESVDIIRISREDCPKSIPAYVVVTVSSTGRPEPLEPPALTSGRARFSSRSASSESPPLRRQSRLGPDARRR